eukprot:TRINITY_DN4678_c0_g4_i2.p1 TRINITY_DN4678_c0_g4~~TRINITY_DN4678_c0_g4_i2.p1  ORF type:complete len:1208 (+),score=437.20 TRINITY_DN4678_c0_g4_i2:43-3666(+)
MFIKEIILEGFKSYATRTVIGPFDREFNAVTGLNGTGKSNILDAICFVMGISVLSQVRVSNLQELVYKQGQAGITKATVSLNFDNTDRESSPPGYEQFDSITVTRQVVIGGRNKYLINGHSAQQSRVQTLFHSVHLNVNNPHFLIMQGRITKVLNMKPPEILGMLEEAAGTRMFETKKEAAQKTIEKKEQKMEEINQVLAQDINPTLEKLRGDRTNFLQFSAVQTEIERLTRFLIAYDYVQAVTVNESAGGDIDIATERIAELKVGCAEAEKAAARTKKRIGELQAKAANSECKQLEASVSELSKVATKAKSELSHKTENLATARNELAKFEAAIAESSHALVAKQQELAQAEQKSADAAKVVADMAAAVEQQLLLQQRAAAGVAETNEKGQTLTEQLMLADKEVVECKVKVEEAKMKIEHLTAQVADKKKQFKAAEKDIARMAAELHTAESEVQSLTEQIAGLMYEPAEEKQLSANREQLQQQVDALRERADALSAKLASLDFQYSDPVKGFQRSRVKGSIASLMTVKDEKFATALEVAAGARLYQIVTDTEETSSLLLNKGQLKRRVTLVPLDRIQGDTSADKKIAAAKKVAGASNVWTALSLVNYDASVSPAIEYALGSTLICKDLEAAQAVAYNKDASMRCKAVTLEGDVCDPAGTVTGGSRPSNGGALLQMASLMDTRSKLSDAEKKLAECKSRIENLAGACKQYQELSQKKELAVHKLSLQQSRNKGSAHAKTQQDFEDLEALIQQQQQVVVDMQAAGKEAQQLVTSLKKQVGSAEKSVKETTQAVQKKLDAARKQHQQSQVTQRTIDAVLDRVKLEIDQIKTEVKEAQSSIGETAANIKSLQGKVNALQADYDEKQAQHDSAHTELTQQRAKLAANDKDIAAASKEYEKLLKSNEDAELEIKNLDLKLQRMKKDHGDAQNTIKALAKKHPWIATEKQYFGQPQSDFDFASRNPHDAHKRLDDLQAQQAQLSKKINKKVMSMFEKAEQEYKDLMAKKTIIENDKAKIESVIGELEEKKNEALKKTWEKVNKDFGSIFGTLLPGTFAKLEPPEGGSVLDGLEVKVAFSGVWKESLTELSGGQRSLLALSLILSLLLFKPAPVYLLDEVDAALDLSHTQNIGRMLKSHFMHSQFIVISLKEGMFNNANVIFRTAFVDGVSAVTRTTPAALAGPAEKENPTTGKGAAALSKKPRKQQRALTETS